MRNFRKGFCQRTEDSAWLFTLNGQRFPTITVEDDRNLLLRIGNLSSNVAYWLELNNESDGKPLRLIVLSLDGVVPAAPVPPEQAKTPVDAFEVNDLLLMPASRAEVYVRNDNLSAHGEQVYILRTKELDTGSDRWPEIQLARIVLKSSKAASSVALALNAPAEQFPAKIFAEKKELPLIIPPPKGCVRDLDPNKGEHRRVTFNEEDPGSPGNVHKVEWSITTEILQPRKEPESGHTRRKTLNPLIRLMKQRPLGMLLSRLMNATIA